MPPPGFELTISTCERPQTYAIDHATSGIDLGAIKIKTYERKSGQYFGRSMD
jgi:hypothetical protein